MTPSLQEIKFATLEDKEEVVAMAKEFFEASPYSSVFPYDEEIMSNLVEGLITQEVIVLSPGRGFLAGKLVNPMFSRDIVATEVAWWVRPDFRGQGISTQLLDGFEYWAECAGAKIVTMSSLNTTNVDIILTNRDYSPTEVAYAKVIR